MVKVAVSGCVHGEIDRLYECLEEVERNKGVKADVLLCTGDFQAVRDEKDMRSLICPEKYRKMGDFCEYFRKEKFAKTLTIIIGGNHESTRFMHKMQHGGWIAPNMYYLGRSGVIKYGSLRIAGISGIYNRHDFDHPLPRFAKSPSDHATIYKIRRSDYTNLSQISTPDIILSHDWPQGIYNYGDTQSLLRKKRFLTESVNNGSLGNPYHMDLMQKLRP